MRRACGEFYPSGWRYVRKVLGESRRFFNGGETPPEPPGVPPQVGGAV
jgi:hypothetical protein